LFLIGFSPRGNECFPGRRSRFPKRCKTCSLCVPHPSEGPDDVRLRLNVPGVVLAHALRLVAQQVGHLRVVGAAGASTTRHRRRAGRAGWSRRRSGRLAPSRAGSGSRGSAFPFRSATAFHRRGPRSGSRTGRGRRGTLEAPASPEGRGPLILARHEAQAHAGELVWPILLQRRAGLAD